MYKTFIFGEKRRKTSLKIYLMAVLYANKVLKIRIYHLKAEHKV